MSLHEVLHEAGPFPYAAILFGIIAVIVVLVLRPSDRKSFRGALWFSIIPLAIGVVGIIVGLVASHQGFQDFLSLHPGPAEVEEAMKVFEESKKAAWRPIISGVVCSVVPLIISMLIYVTRRNKP